jgi:hypothetical protein
MISFRFVSFLSLQMLFRFVSQFKDVVSFLRISFRFVVFRFVSLCFVSVSFLTLQEPKLARYRSLFNSLHLLLTLFCKTLHYVT